MLTSADPTPQPTRWIKDRGLTISSQRQGERHILALHGQLDIASEKALDQELKRVEATDAGQIILDLSRLDYMDSSGLRVILTAHGRASEGSDRLRLRRGPHAVQQVFEITRTARLLAFVD
jgi:anti-sigma B factor antagonist